MVVVRASRGGLLYLRWTVQKKPGCIFWTVQKIPGCILYDGLGRVGWVGVEW